MYFWFWLKICQTKILPVFLKVSNISLYSVVYLILVSTLKPFLSSLQYIIIYYLTLGLQVSFVLTYFWFLPKPKTSNQKIHVNLKVNNA